MNTLALCPHFVLSDQESKKINKTFSRKEFLQLRLDNSQMRRKNKSFSEIEKN